MCVLHDARVTQHYMLPHAQALCSVHEPSSAQHEAAAYACTQGGARHAAPHVGWGSPRRAPAGLPNHRRLRRRQPLGIAQPLQQRAHLRVGGLRRAAPPCHAAQPRRPPPGVQHVAYAARTDAHDSPPGLASAGAAVAQTCPHVMWQAV